MWRVGGRGGEVRTEFWWGDLKKGDYLEEVGVEWTIILKWVCKEKD
jgi:hypothetical protein